MSGEIDYIVRCEGEKYVVPAAVGREIERLRKACAHICTLYETACREEDPEDPESEWDENDPDGHAADWNLFQRAARVAQTALTQQDKESGSGIEQALRDATSQLAECYRLTGADPDGDSDSMLAKFAVEEVRRMRQELDAAEDKEEHPDQGSEETAIRGAVEAAVGAYAESERGMDEALDAGCDLSELPTPMDIAVRTALQHLRSADQGTHHAS